MRHYREAVLLCVSTQCLNNPYAGGCNNAYYNNYGGYGYQAYPYQSAGYNHGNSSLCSCPQGSRPVYNGNFGTGCIAQSALPTYSRVYYWSWSAQSTYNNHYVNWNQYSNIRDSGSTTASSNNGCYNNVAWSCLVGQNNQCPGGTTCKATAQNAPIGVCVQ